MVDFTLSDEQRALRELAHDFAEREIRPVAWALDRDATFPRELIAQGLGGRSDEPPHPRGASAARAWATSTAALIEEELSWGCSGVQTSIGGNSLALTPLLLAGSERCARATSSGSPRRRCSRRSA